MSDLTKRLREAQARRLPWGVQRDLFGEAAVALDAADEAVALLREMGEYADIFDHWTDPLPDGFTVAIVKLEDLRGAVVPWPASR